MLSDAKVAAFRQQAADYMVQCAPDSFAYGKAIGILAVLNDLPAAEPADAGRDALLGAAFRDISARDYKDAWASLFIAHVLEKADELASQQAVKP